MVFINYIKKINFAFYIMACLFGIEQVAFSTEEEPQKKGGYWGKAKNMANTAKEDVMKSKTATKAANMAHNAKEVADAAKDRVLNSKTGREVQKAISDVKSKICTFKLNQARSNADKLETQSGQLYANSYQLAAIARNQTAQAAQVKESCGGGIFCTIALKLSTYNERKYSELAEKMKKMAEETAQASEEASKEIEELEDKCASN